MFFFKLKKKYQLHAVHAAVVLRHSISHYSPNFSRHCMLSSGTERQGFDLVPERRNENINK